MWPKPTRRASVGRSFAIVSVSVCLLLFSHAAEAGQAGEDRWVPSFALTAGFTIQQDHRGDGSSFIRDLNDVNPTFTPLREPVQDMDTAVSPFVGGSFELMAPALPILTRPRFFIGGEILPTFAPGRDVAVEGDPGCIRGPEPNVPCALDEDGSRQRGFGEGSLNGTGTVVESRIGTMIYGAHIGLSFPFEFSERQFRIKPSFGWINFKVSGSGTVVDGACQPAEVCTDFQTTSIIPGFPPFTTPGFLREVNVSARHSERFNAIGPRLDLEMDTGQFGPLGVSLFIGGGAFVVLDNRTISFGTTETFNDLVGNDEVAGRFEIEIDQWMYRAHVGIRFQFIGAQP